MKVFENVEADKLNQVLERPSLNFSRVEKIVTPILEKVKRGGDRALKKFALEYDHVELKDLWVSEEELKAAHDVVGDSLKRSIDVAKTNILRFHEAQKVQPLEMEVMPGVHCSRRSIPIRRVGLYIPGGTAPLFSTVLMLGIPARIAGCDEIILSSPPNNLGEINPIVLYAADLLGITKVIKLGGAQAIAAMAYGTESVPRVDKIFGPGNQYVTVAKQLVARDTVAIDMPAGPSEVMVVVDGDSKASFAASDLLSQAEHGIDSQVVLVSTSREKAEKVIKKIKKQLTDLPRKHIAEKALRGSVAIIVNSKKEMLNVIDSYGPEHLILLLKNAHEIAGKVSNVGSVFIGPYTPESFGDYASGTNHTLPTNGWANAYSGVSLDSFLKKITYQEVSKKGLKKLGPVVQELAEAEHLYGHKNAVSIRLRSLQND